MEEDDLDISISEEDLIKNKKEDREMSRKNKDKKPKKSSKKKVILIVVILLILAGGGVGAYFLLNQKDETAESVELEKEVKKPKYYDNLTGEEIATEAEAEAENSKRISCVQIPNGTDARPQVGLTNAKIVFEAIAEAGITRFAAIYRGASDNVIGPVRSLRMYYLEWDDPFDCTIVHAGGEANALKKVESYKHLAESKTYMWRDYSNWSAPNNLFTSAELLDKFNSDNSYNSSTPKVFARMTTDENETQISEIKAETESSSESEAESSAKKYETASDIYVHVTTAINYNVKYNYDASSNSYLRSYEGNSGKHMVYNCQGLATSGADIKPAKDCGDLVQVAPKVVIVMKVDEQVNQINHYREDLATTGSGEVYVFQNGIVIKGTWEKSSISSQIIFKDSAGEVIKLAPGQTFITSIAKSYGYVKH